MRQYFVYIMTNKSGTLYTGETNNLLRRVHEHKNKSIKGFTKRYNITRLVWYDRTRDVRAAIEKEKQIKGWVRKKKIRLIESVNPGWRDLSEDFEILRGACPDRGAQDDKGENMSFFASFATSR